MAKKEPVYFPEDKDVPELIRLSYDNMRTEKNTHLNKYEACALTIQRMIMQQRDICEKSRRTERVLHALRAMYLILAPPVILTLGYEVQQ